MKRREFITILGRAAAAWPLAARAQQPAMPVVRLVGGGSGDTRYVTAFRKGLNETGIIEGQNVTVEYHWLKGQIQVLNASTSGEIDAAFATLVRDRADALFVAPNSFFISRRVQFATLTARDRIPAAYSDRSVWAG